MNNEPLTEAPFKRTLVRSTRQARPISVTYNPEPPPPCYHPGTAGNTIRGCVAGGVMAGFEAETPTPHLSVRSSS